MEQLNINKKYIRELVKETLIQEDFGSWVKDVGEKTWDSTKKIGKSIGRETKETVVAAKILSKLIRNKEPSEKEVEFLKSQSVDLGKALILLGLQAIPGSSIGIIAIEKMLKKKGLTIFPKEQEVPN